MLFFPPLVQACMPIKCSQAEWNTGLKWNLSDDTFGIQQLKYVSNIFHNAEAHHVGFEGTDTAN